MKYFISIYAELGGVALDGIPVAESNSATDVAETICRMDKASIIYLSTKEESVSYHLQEDGNVKLDLDDCAEESIAEYQLIEQKVNEWRRFSRDRTCAVDGGA